MAWKKYCDMTQAEKEHQKELHREWVRRNPERNEEPREIQPVSS